MSACGRLFVYSSGCERGEKEQSEEVERDLLPASIFQVDLLAIAQTALSLPQRENKRRGREGDRRERERERETGRQKEGK